MNSKVRALAAAITLMVMCAGTIIITFPVSASEAGTAINSKGNFVLGNGEKMALYASDIDYLQEDMNNLYAELPALPDVSFPGIERKNYITSKGVVDYLNGTVVIDSSDFTYLADEIDILESAYKINTANALKNIGTYFLEDGSVTYNPDDAADLEMLPFDKLYGGILTSQSVAHLSGQQAANIGGEALYYASETAKNNNSLVMPTTTDNGFPLFIQASASENISSGAAAWVDGELLIGNGADNTAFYNQGYVDGFNKAMDGVSIEYQYHEHVGNENEYGGCYTGGYHVHSGCPHHTETHRCGHNDTHVCPTHGPEWAWTFICEEGHTHYCCNYTTEEEIYDCGSPVNRYSITCGKTSGTIESATIIFK